MSNIWTQIGADILPVDSSDENSSISVSSNGVRAAIGNKAGVRIFERVNNSWNQLGQQLIGNRTDSGHTVSLNSDGTRVAISSVWGNVVSIYDFDGTAWVQAGSQISGTGEWGTYNLSLNSDGNTIVIGGPKYAAPGEPAWSVSRGYVGVYRWDGSSWNQLGNFIVGQTDPEKLGDRVSISSNGNRIALGATGYDSGTGRVFIYDWDGSNWNQVGNSIVGERDWDVFGGSVSMSSDGTRVAIGAPFNDNNMMSTNGRVYVYDWNGSSWTQVGSDIDGEEANDGIGHSVSLSSDGKRLAIGMPLKDIGGHANKGRVQIYEWKNNTWTQVSVNIDGTHANAQLGYSVSLNSDGSRLGIVAKGASLSGAYSEIYLDPSISSGGATGDPYVTTLSGVTYKMADFTGFSRMLQGTLDNKTFTLNAETTLLTKYELADLVMSRNRALSAEQLKHFKNDEFPAYFTKLYASWGEDSITIDIKNHEIIQSTMKDTYETTQDVENQYVWDTAKTKVEKMCIPFGPVTLVVKKNMNPDIRNGFTVLGSYHIQNKVGALVKPMYTKDIKLKKLTSVKAIDESINRKPKRVIQQEFHSANGDVIIKEFPIY